MSNQKFNFILVFFFYFIVWSFADSLGIFRPIRELLQLRKRKKKKDPKAVSKMLQDTDQPIRQAGESVQSLCCPSCRLPFDKAKRRRLVDSCGHERCCSCMLKSSRCLQCQELLIASPVVRKRSEDKPSPTISKSAPRVKTNGHFTAFMKTRSNVHDGPASLLTEERIVLEDDPFAMEKLYQPIKRSTLNEKSKKPRPSTLSADSPGALADEELPSKAPSRSRPQDQPKTDLYMRLGLLLGTDPEGKTYPKVGDYGSQGSYASISSLGSNEAHQTASSNNTSPVSTLTSSEEQCSIESNASPSCSNPTLSRSGLGLRGTSKGHSFDSVASLTSAGTTGSRSIASSTSSGGITYGRTNFQRQNYIRLSDRCLPIGKRTAFVRRSDRSNSGPPSSSQINKGRLYALRAAQIPFKPIFFEVPQTEVEPLFMGRHWLYQSIHKWLLNTDANEANSRGVVVNGCPGSGKTAAIFQLVDYSHFGSKKGDPVYQDLQMSKSSYDGFSTQGSSIYHPSSSSSGHSSMSSSLYQSQLSLNPNSLRHLAGHIVSYHFCQTDNSVTCLVPEFLHNLATQLCQAPQLVAFRELLLEDGKYREMLSLPSCIADPSEALVKGILEPLHTLRRQGKIPNTVCLMVIDALNEAEFYRPDYGSTLAAFLGRHILQFPSWLKLVVTVRTEFLPVTKPLPFQQISLDNLANNEHLHGDLENYISRRIASSSEIQRNLTVSHVKGESSSNAEFTTHLVQLSKGCFLHVKMVLDLLHKSHLVVKYGSYRAVPINLFQVYLLLFNIKFATNSAFEKISRILQVCLSSLRPLTSLEIYHSINAGTIQHPLSWSEFLTRLSVLTGAQFLVERRDGTYMLAHPSLREWLSRPREEIQNQKFLCDGKAGNALIALCMSRLQAPLEKEQILTLGHHMLKAHLFKGNSSMPRQCGGSRDLQALWLLMSCDDLSAGLACPRNAYSPNIKVSRLLLLAGADPDACCSSHQMESTHLMIIAARLGFPEFVALLLEFGGNPNVKDESGNSALSIACQQGHLKVVQLLIQGGGQLDEADETTGWTPLVWAAANGHMKVVSFIIESDWGIIESPSQVKNQVSFAKAAQQGLVVAAQNGHEEVCNYLLDLPDVMVNNLDPISGHTALSAASFSGRVACCNALIKRGAAVSIVNARKESPLAGAVSEGQWEVAELLLSQRASIEQRDDAGRTPLMIASAQGHLGILELLLSKGANVSATDKECVSALGWAAKNGQLQSIQCLLDHGADIYHTDRQGCTPLDLAASQGDPEVIRLLLERGAVMEHVDLNGMRPLDKAISFGHSNAVSCFLYKGAKLGPQTWAMAEGKTEMLLLLLNKLLDDGSQLYKKGRLKEAAHRYQYALKKFPSSALTGVKGQTFETLKFHLHLGLARSRRKLNELLPAKEAVDVAISLRPTAYEGFYVRACIKRDLGKDSDALSDAEQAAKLVPQHIPFRKTVLSLRDDLQETLHKVISPLPSVPEDKALSEAHFNPKPLSVSTETLDQVGGISLDGISFSSQKSLSKPFLSVLPSKVSIEKKQEFLDNRKGFETAM